MSDQDSEDDLSVSGEIRGYLCEPEYNTGYWLMGEKQENRAQKKMGTACV